jgi:hypothetical protein
MHAGSSSVHAAAAAAAACMHAGSYMPVHAMLDMYMYFSDIKQFY